MGTSSASRRHGRLWAIALLGALAAGGCGLDRSQPLMLRVAAIEARESSQSLETIFRLAGGRGSQQPIGDGPLSGAGRLAPRGFDDDLFVYADSLHFHWTDSRPIGAATRAATPESLHCRALEVLVSADMYFTGDQRGAAVTLRCLGQESVLLVPESRILILPMGSRDWPPDFILYVSPQP